MRRFAARLAALATALACVVAALTLATSPAGAAPQYPVPYDFLPSAVVAGVNFTADPPGANDWNCRPGAAHPRPVVLVHGLTGDKTTNWQTYAPLLANNGYCVYALTYGRSPLLPAPYDEAFGGLVPMQQSARQLQAFVAKVLAATGASQVDIVGHSEGTVMPDSTPSSSVVPGTSTRTSPWRRCGTAPARSAWPPWRRSGRRSG